MPFQISAARRGGRLAALAGVLALCGLAAPAAQAATTASNPYDCTVSSTSFSQTFLGFGDSARYTPVTNAGLESATTGWTLSSGAKVVADQEPWNVGGVGTHALDLPNGSSAVTAPICVDGTYPYFRLFAKDVNASGANLQVEVLQYDARGRIQKNTPVTFTATGAGWQATSQFAISALASGTSTAAPIAFRFTPMGRTAHFTIDDVFVDPWCRG